MCSCDGCTFDGPLIRVCLQAQAVFRDRALIFLIATCEESSQGTKHENKIFI